MRNEKIVHRFVFRLSTGVQSRQAQDSIELGGDRRSEQHFRNFDSESLQGLWWTSETDFPESEETSGRLNRAGLTRAFAFGGSGMAFV